MVVRMSMVAAAAALILVLTGCGDGGDDFFSGQTGAAGGGASLDIAGTYLVTPDVFGFNMMTIFQNGSGLTAQDNGGGSWSGRLSNVH